MSLQDKLNQQKQMTGTNSSKTQNSEEINELKKQNEMLMKRMIEIEKDQDTRNRKIDRLLSELDDSMEAWNYKIATLKDSTSSHLVTSQKENYNQVKSLLIEQTNLIMQNHKERKELQNNFYKFKAYSLLTLHVIAMILLIAVISRVLAYGIWEGLRLNIMWETEEWYWMLLSIFIVVALVSAVIYLIYRGIKNKPY